MVNVVIFIDRLIRLLREERLLYFVIIRNNENHTIVPRARTDIREPFWRSGTILRTSPPRCELCEPCVNPEILGRGTMAFVIRRLRRYR